MLTLDMQDHKQSIPPGLTSITGFSVTAILPTIHADQVIICNKSPTLALVSLAGKVKKND
jgi:hypothetical protein